MNKNTTHILTASAPRKVGVLNLLTSTLSQFGAYMNEVHSFDDVESNLFFFRTAFCFGDGKPFDEAEFNSVLNEKKREYEIDWQLSEISNKPRVVILVSKHDHCLNDLLYRYRTQQLQIEIPAIISNHPDLAELAKWHDIPYYHLPISAETKHQQESQVMEIVHKTNADLVVLARYMQVLSQDMCQKLDGWAINIHHSLLPCFKGARPYEQAFNMGVKLVGATAHYVTSDLDEGPIITQCVETVDHTYNTKDLTEKGRHIECQTLARAIKYHIEKRIFVDQSKTIIFATA
ncbi:formyltetrahydrofolate deformylase [Marinomonas lutimaris]|jgi:formyltetrahydrofolate deformylase|uniref:formyltetrahydrofolate deformylase n=1 Tax=Marinomonas lutimaris TaxID=2846746 RepID=UPI001CA4DC06|nr:formyltetrahydrofolate deformylase [Marinomonas lutimaris]